MPVLTLLSAALFAASATAASAPAPAPALAQLSALLNVTLPRRLAPSINLSAISVRAGGQATYTPTVLMHGLGDAGSNAGMQSLAKSVMTAYPGAYATAVNVANTLFSFIVPIMDQVHELAAAIRADPKLAGAPEVNMVGLSQGGLVIRGYAQVYGSEPGYPRVKNLVSICGVQSGVFNCPAELQIIPLLCDVFEADPYNFLFNGSIPLSFSDYFTTYWNRSMYDTQNDLLPVLNNQVPHANSSLYKRNMERIRTVVLSQATQDTVVYPYESEQFGGYAWATTKAHPVTLNFTQGYSYAGDLIGLRTRAENGNGSLVLSEFVGDHIRFNDSYCEVPFPPFPLTLPPFLGEALRAFPPPPPPPHAHTHACRGHCHHALSAVKWVSQRLCQCASKNSHLTTPLTSSLSPLASQNPNAAAARRHH
jgi:palmitoyl-protein thioesterase